MDRKPFATVSRSRGGWRPVMMVWDEEVQGYLPVGVADGQYGNGKSVQVAVEDARAFAVRRHIEYREVDLAMVSSGLRHAEFVAGIAGKERLCR